MDLCLKNQFKRKIECKMLNSIIKFFLGNKLVTVLLLLLIVVWGIVTAPFNWEIGFLPRDPVPVDAIPDIGENQQIVFTEWMGRSPQDVDCLLYTSDAADDLL